MGKIIPLKGKLKGDLTGLMRKVKKESIKKEDKK